MQIGQLTPYTLVVGLGVSGLAAVRFLRSRGERVVATDSRPAAAFGPVVDELTQLGVKLELGGHDCDSFLRASRIVLSPGVPPIPELVAAQVAGVEILGEFELAAREIEAPLLVVTGTNGKSTTTSLLGEVLKLGGRPTFVGGNLGRPLVEAIGWPRDGFVVAEASSFQLETVEKMRARVAVLLNVTPDHLDRYPSFDAYAEAKGRVFLNQIEEDFAVINADDPVCVRLAATTRARRLEFRAAPYPGLSLQGRHNEENAQAAFTAARAVGASEEHIAEAARTFRALPHRMELVGEKDGVRFIDDSKGTNVGAVVKSLQGFEGQPGRVALILGGRDKGGSYEPLRALCQSVCRVVVLIGEAADRIAEGLAGAASCQRAATLEEAVALAHSRCQPGDVVLLSPACSSYDMFRDYKERGQRIRAAVRALGGTEDGGTP